MAKSGILSLLGLVLAACSTEPDSTQPEADMISPTPRQLDAKAHPGEALLRQLAGEIPGFAGLWYDNESQTFQVAGTDVQTLAGRSHAIRAALIAEFPELLPDASMRAHQFKYDFTQLSDWRRRASIVFSDSRVMGLDLDERANKIAVIVSEETARDWVSNALKGAGIPTEAARIDVEDRQQPLIGLQDHQRPQIQNGFRIAYPIPGGIGFCTHGADVTAPGGPVKGFLTNSHCNKLGGAQLNAGTGTAFYQHSVSSSHRIGTSTINPNLFTGGQCPAGKSCRYSDAQFVDYSSDSYFSNKYTAEATVIGTGTSPGSLTVALTFSPKAGARRLGLSPAA